MQNKIDFLFDILKRYDHYIATTNFKVGLTMSFLLTVILGLIHSSMSFGTNNNVNKFVFFLLVVLVVITVAISLIAIVYLFSVVFPNTNTPVTYKSLIFFGDVANTTDGANSYYEKIKNASEEDILKDIAFQTFTVAEITTDKFKKLQTVFTIIKRGVLPFFFLSIIFLLCIR